MISIAMIVRDEEATLGRALDSFAPHVDEVVVVDNNAAEGTREEVAATRARCVHEIPVDFNPHAPCAIAFGGLNENAAITTAEIINDIAAFDLSHFQHAVDHLGRDQRAGGVGMKTRILPPPPGASSARMSQPWPETTDIAM